MQVIAWLHDFHIFRPLPGRGAVRRPGMSEVRQGWNTAAQILYDKASNLVERFTSGNPSATTLPARLFEQFLDLRIERQAPEHADIRAARVSGWDNPDRRAQGAKDDSNELA